jgi:hypothetical protein
MNYVLKNLLKASNNVSVQPLDIVVGRREVVLLLYSYL